MSAASRWPFSRLSCRCLGGRVIKWPGLKARGFMRFEAPNCLSLGSPRGRTGAVRGGPEVGRRKETDKGATLHNKPVM